MFRKLKRYYIKFRLFARRVNRWQRSDVAKPIVDIDPTQHVCGNCGEEFQGRFCTQCGKPAARKRFTFKNVILGFLEIWGFGSRPMFRTMAQLFTRPGYMIRDYLNGHYLRYFPPFKMLVVLTLLFVVECKVLGLEFTSQNIDEELQVVKTSSDVRDKVLADVVEVFEVGRSWFEANPTSAIILQYVFFILAARIVYRKSGLNLPETFIAHIYIGCQMQIMAIVVTLATLRIVSTGILPHHLPSALMIPFLFYDHHQLYDKKWWTTIWKTSLVIALSLTFSLVAIFIASIGLATYFLSTI